jgi:hypothetical protein
MSKKPHHNFVRYSSLAFQMGIIVFAAAFGGIKLDEQISSVKFPVFTVSLTLFGVFAAVYLTIKDLMNNNNDK